MSAPLSPQIKKKHLCLLSLLSIFPTFSPEDSSFLPHRLFLLQLSPKLLEEKLSSCLSAIARPGCVCLNYFAPAFPAEHCFFFYRVRTERTLCWEWAQSIWWHYTECEMRKIYSFIHSFMFLLPSNSIFTFQFLASSRNQIGYISPLGSPLFTLQLHF